METWLLNDAKRQERNAPAWMDIIAALMSLREKLIVIDCKKSSGCKRDQLVKLIQIG